MRAFNNAQHILGIDISLLEFPLQRERGIVAGGCRVAVHLVRYRRELTAQKMLPSTAKGTCLDHAAMESFWATLKKPVYPHKCFATRDGACQATFGYIHVFYNRERLHSSLSYTSPEVFEALRQPLEGLDILAA